MSPKEVPLGPVATRMGPWCVLLLSLTLPTVLQGQDPTTPPQVANFQSKQVQGWQGSGLGPKFRFREEGGGHCPGVQAGRPFSQAPLASNRAGH